MRWFYLVLLCQSVLRAQTTADIIAGLEKIHTDVAGRPCSTGVLLSNRALNLFLANKIGSYLSEFSDLSFYKNNTTFNAAAGTFSVNHNFFQPKGTDEPVRSLLVAGAQANVAQALASALTGRSYSNEIGATIKQTWIAPVKHFSKSCVPVGYPGKGSSQPADPKEEMNAQRAAISHALETEIKQKEADFETTLQAIKPTDVPGQDLAVVQAGLRKKFYAGLKEEYARNFANLQSVALLETNRYGRISTNWTSLSTYIPLIRQQFYVAESYVQPFEKRYAYPWVVTLSHTRFWENPAWGRLFFTLSAGIGWNNSARSKRLPLMNLAYYKSQGGTDTLRLAELGAESGYIGAYQNFFTPVGHMQLIYFPPDSHIGLSFRLEKNVGIYSALNGRLGFPIVLIDKKGDPAANFEFQIRYTDLSNKLSSPQGAGVNISIGLTVGIPFSKIIY